MKTIVILLVALGCVVPSFAAANGSAAKTAAAAKKATMSLAEARAKIGDAIKNPKLVTSIMRRLAPADQVKFLADLNQAIMAMPGSSESKAALFLNVDKAALVGASKGNVTQVLAEVFATVPPEALTVVNERLASDLFNRKADPATAKMTDAEFTKMAESVMKVVNERTAQIDGGAARSAFAILMLVRSSGGDSSAQALLTETLVQTLPSASQNVARTEWIPAALGATEAKTYEPLLGGAGSTYAAPELGVVLRFAGPQLIDTLIGDITEGTPFINTVNNIDINVQPMREKDNDMDTPTEPIGYQGQTL